jgi:hypothetical protein
MSALVVKSHITEGLELARKERLPRAVQNAIPEHHGTMVMAFFYVKAQELDPGVRREDYCYPGPKPRSRETAILMLADGVEGRIARARGAHAEPDPRARHAHHRRARAGGPARPVRAHAPGPGEDPRGVHPGPDSDLPRARPVPEDPSKRARADSRSPQGAA